jgi:hypothetical protein
MAVAPGRTALGRPAIPIDMAAFAYHWSALKMTRRTLFFSGLARGRDFLALGERDDGSFVAAPFAVPFEGMFFAIVYHPLIPTAPYLSSDSGAVTEGSGPRPRQRFSSGRWHNPLSMKAFAQSPGITPTAALS